MHRTTDTGPGVQRPGGAVLLRTTRLVARSTRVVAGCRPRSSTSLAAVSAISMSGWRTVVSGGPIQRVSGRSSKPTTLRSSGMRRPSSRAASYTPSACRSLCAKRPVGGFDQDAEIILLRERDGDAQDDLAEYIEAAAAESAARKRKNRAKARLLHHLGNAEMAVMGDMPAYSYDAQSREHCDVKRLAELWPEAYADCVEDRTSRRINIPERVREEHL